MAFEVSEFMIIVLAIVLRAILLTLSMIGWLLYLTGWGLIYNWILNGKEGQVQTALDGYFPEYKSVLSPLWILAGVPLPLYLLNLAHMLLPAAQWQMKRKGRQKEAHRITNSAHVIHTIMNLMEMWYYMSAAVAITMVALILAINEQYKEAAFIEGIYQFNIHYLRIMSAGVIMTTFFYWLSTTWPLFSLRRRRGVSDYQELEETLSH